MALKKTTKPLVDKFEAALPKDRRAQTRTMFGNPCCFVNGNMFTGLHEEQVIVRLPEQQRARLLRLDGAAIFEPMKGRPMKEYVRVPPAMLENQRQLRGWIQRAFEYGLTLPPKKRQAS